MDEAEAPDNKEPDTAESPASQDNGPEPDEPPETALDEPPETTLDEPPETAPDEPPETEDAQQSQDPSTEVEQGAFPPEVTAPLDEETAGGPEHSRFKPSPRTAVETSARRASKFRRSTSGVQSLQETLDVC